MEERENLLKKTKIKILIQYYLKIPDKLKDMYKFVKEKFSSEENPNISLKILAKP